MRLGIVIYSSHAETVWNAFRLGLFSVKQSDSVTIFLLAQGVECESLHADQFPFRTLMQHRGERAKLRAFRMPQLQAGSAGPGSRRRNRQTPQDLYEIVRDSDKVVSF